VHHSAQKSTTTGFELASTTCGNSEEDTLTGPASASGELLMTETMVGEIKAFSSAYRWYEF